MAEVKPDDIPSAEALFTPWEVAQRQRICFGGFWPDQPVFIEITYPDGTVETGKVMPQDGVTWNAMPGEPLGEYVLIAQQDGRRAEARFSVVPPTGHNILVMPESASPGTTFSVAIAGYAPNTSVSLSLYKKAPWEADYITTLGEAITDDRGEAIIQVRTLESDPEGEYVVDTVPSAHDLHRPPAASFRLAVEPNQSAEATNSIHVTPQASAVVTSEASLFQRRDTPPEGVAAQLSFGGGGSNACNSGLYERTVLGNQYARVDTLRTDWSIPSRQWKEEVISLTSGQGFCFAWFQPNRFIEAVVQRPDGTTVQRRVATDEAGFGVWPWYALPGDPPGTYVVSGQLDGSSIATQFEVRLPTSRGMLVYPPSNPLGGTFSIYLHGFEPNEVLSLYLYRDDQPGLSSYLSTLPSIQMDETGSAVYRLDSQPEDIPGQYWIVTPDPGNPEQIRDLARFNLGIGERLMNDAIVSASSTLPPEMISPDTSVDYDPTNVLDYGSETAWAEGAPGAGIGERLVLEFTHELQLSALDINVGFDRDEAIFFANNRLKRGTLIFSDGSALPIEFEDQRGVQTVPLPDIRTTSLTLVIEDVYPGTTYDDTAIATLHPFGYGIAP